MGKLKIYLHLLKVYSVIFDYLWLKFGSETLKSVKHGS